MNLCLLSSTAKSHPAAADAASSPATSSPEGATPASARATGFKIPSAARDAMSYAPSVAKCLAQSRIGPGPACTRI